MDYLAAPDSRTELFDLVDGSSQGLFLDERDAMFLVAVEEGNLELVQSMLNQDNRPVNINAINSDGLTALQIALENKREEIVKELVDKGADLKLALLQSVFDNDLDCAKMLLTRKSKSETKHSDSYISPIILAAQMGLYEMVHLLLKNEHFIRLPHQYCCDCEQCEKKSDMLRSQIAINRFRGLSSPTYMCLSYMVENCGKEDPDSHNLAMKDPVTQAFELNTMLERRADEEPEFKKEYLKLSERCKRFSVDLYNECRSMEEITALLDIDEHQFNLSRRTRIKKESRANVMKIFRRAIKSDHKEVG